MSFMDATKACFGKYATFAGRAQRSEFWYFMLFIWIGVVICSFIDSALWEPREVLSMAGSDSFQNGMSFNFAWQPQPITGIFMLATLLPNISVMVRRLHDTARSGWWYWIALIPLVGFIVLLVFFMPSKQGRTPARKRAYPSASGSLQYLGLV